MPEEAEIETLIGKAKRRIDAAHHLLGEGFYEDAVNRAYLQYVLCSEGATFEEGYNGGDEQIIQFLVRYRKKKLNPLSKTRRSF